MDDTANEETLRDRNAGPELDGEVFKMLFKLGRVSTCTQIFFDQPFFAQFEILISICGMKDMNLFGD